MAETDPNDPNADLWIAVRPNQGIPAIFLTGFPRTVVLLQEGATLETITPYARASNLTPKQWLRLATMLGATPHHLLTGTCPAIGATTALVPEELRCPSKAA